MTTNLESPRAADAPVLVTGAASGLGAAVVDVLHAASFPVAALDRREPAALVDHEVADLADLDATEKAVQAIAARHGGLAGIVTCAGIDACGALADIPPEDWERVVTVNLLGTVRVVRAALPALLARAGTASPGRVVTIASTLGLRAVGDATAYCASKFGVVGFTRSLAVELAGRVGVTLVVPGGMNTPFFDGRPEQYKPPADFVMNDPRRVAAAIAFALQQPPGCEVRELVVCPSGETSWP